MVRKISLLLVLAGLSTTMLQADYVIQLGVYKERATPEKALKGIKDPQLRSDVNIVKRGNVFWAYTKPFADKSSKKGTLKQYKTVFTDAYFREYSSSQSKEKVAAPKADEGFDPLAFVKTVVPPKEEKSAAPKADEGFDPLEFVKTVVPPKK